MAYDEHLADRIRALLADSGDVAELKMFGGWCATVAGNMAIGVLGDDLIVRVGPTAYPDALSEAGGAGVRLQRASDGRLGVRRRIRGSDR